MLGWGANIKRFKVPLFRTYFNLSSSLLDNILGSFYVFNGKFIITSVQSTCKMPHNSNSRVHRKLKKISSRKQNSNHVHAKPTDDCFKAISPLNLVISTIVFISVNRFHQYV